MLIYSNLESDFKILDYGITHSTLLLRSFKNRTREYNIDVLFKVVDFVMIPDTIKGLELSVVEVTDTVAALLAQFNVRYEEKLGDRMFCLTDANGTKYYIVASVVGIFYTYLQLQESIIGPFSNVTERSVIWYNGNEVEHRR